jgi:hypothetical protein
MIAKTGFFNGARFAALSLSFLIVVGTALKTAAADSASEFIALAQTIRSSWDKIDSISYDLVSRDEMTAEFIDRFGIAGTDRGTVTREFSFFMKDGDYGWKTSTTLASGVKERVSRGSFRDKLLMILFLDNEPLAATATLPKSVADTPISEYLPVLDAFSFLTPEKWGYGPAPIVTLEDLHSPELWADALKRILSVGEDTVGSQACIKVDFRISGESHMCVSFAKNGEYTPLKWQYFNGEGKLSLDVSVSQLDQLTIPGGGKLALPKQLTVHAYHPSTPPFLMGIRKQECRKFSVNAQLEGDEFSVDPSMASLIYDRDNKNWIKVPN